MEIHRPNVGNIIAIFTVGWLDHQLSRPFRRVIVNWVHHSGRSATELARRCAWAVMTGASLQALGWGGTVTRVARAAVLPAAVSA